MQFILAFGCDRDISFSKFYNACIYQLVEKFFFHEMICLLQRQRHDGQHPNLVANCMQLFKNPVFLTCIRKHFHDRR